MAYVLGFWFADGYMRIEKSYRVVISSKDKQILEDISKALESDHPIKESKSDGCSSISFHSKYLYKSLQRRGGFRCKGRTITFPRIPKKYLRDFIRGYFDGDGSVFFVNYIRTKDGRPTKELRTNFTSGSRKFLETLMRIISNEIGLPIKKLGIFNEGSSLKLGYGMKDSDTLLHYLYYDNFPIALNRKSVFVSKIPKYQNHFLHKSNSYVK
mgnify:CR=1 FL=1